MTHFRNLANHVRESIVPCIQMATVPIYVIQDNTIKRGHTAVFVRLGMTHLLLTAAHSIKEMIDMRLPILAGWDESAGRPVHLQSADFHVAKPSTSYDVALATLSDEQTSALQPNNSPISLANIQPRDDDPNGIYLLCGCPQAYLGIGENHELTSPCINFLCDKYTGERTPDPDDPFTFNSRMHCMFTVSRDAVDAHTSKHVALPDKEGMKGISGCGIWKVGTIEGTTLLKYSLDDVALCALEHRYSQRDGYVVATWIEYVVQGVLERHPDIRTIFGLYSGW